MFLNRITTCRSFLNSTSRLTLKRCFILPATTDKASIIPLIKQQQQERNDTDTWNGIMSQLAASGRSEQAQHLYDSIFRSHGILANMATFYHLMLAYINHGQYHDAMGIYYQIRDHEASPQDTVKNLQLDEHMYNHLVQSLAEKSKTSDKKEYTPSQQEVFGSTIEDDDELYNEESQPELLAALTLLKDMRQHDMTPTNTMYIALLNAGAHHRDSFIVHRVHTLIRMDPYFEPGPTLYTTLMRAYHCIGEGDAVMDLWDRYQIGLDVAIETCVQYQYQQRLQHLWDTLSEEQRRESGLDPLLLKEKKSV
ncbi:hypothetical protein K501DRAFT_288997 [Backusella circina FSU 941]|nr:hypothetical protein K501DRAFT_288997 [Backusella circina FSU 941]